MNEHPAARDLDGKVAIVTGAANGIGQAVATVYARAGACVMLADRDAENAQRIRDTLIADGAEAAFFPIDVRDEAAHSALVEATLARFGGLDIACNNAGISGGVAPLADYAPQTWREVIDINLSGVFYGMRAQITAMLRRGGGAIVNMASVLGAVSFVGAPAYTAAKHGVIGLTKSAAFDYGSAGIRVNAVVPGFIDTPLLKTVLQPDEYARIEQRHLLGRLGTPDEVAQLVLWLSSSRASFCTGGAFPVDGGYLAQ